MRCSLFVLVLVLCSLRPGLLLADDPAPPAKAEHIVIMVWDGLRPDSITDETTPTLARLARGGVTFTRHHPVYPSSTEVNGTAMATGCFPGHTGLIGNREYRPAIDPLKTIATEAREVIRKGDEISGGHYLHAPTLPELAHAAGWRTAVAGTKSVALLWDRAERPDVGGPAIDSVNLVAGHTIPPGAARVIDDANDGPFPPFVNFPNTAEDAWTVRALTTTLWKDGPPKLSVLWLSDPDFTQHQFGPDSPQARRALAGCDAQLTAVLAALDAGHWRDKTDVFVVSDHGFSTIAEPLDMADRLTAAGFQAAREFKTTPKPGDVLVNGLGGAVFLYVAEHDPATIQRLVDFLQGSEFAGVIFTRAALPGTFTLDTVHLDDADAPDVVVSLRWSDEKNAAGFPGKIFADVNSHSKPGNGPSPRREGQGTHSTFSRYDMHNTLVAAGPDLRVGYRDALPSSNADLAPTIARLLGLPHPPPMDGRVLAEALTGATEPGAPAVATQRLESAHENDKIHWRQYLQVSRWGGETYFDEGNAVIPAPLVISSPTPP